MSKDNDMGGRASYLTGLNSRGRARVMAKRPDCPIDLDALNSRDRARVMINRPDCPIDDELEEIK